MNGILAHLRRLSRPSPLVVVCAAIVVCTLLLVAHRRSLRITPVHSALPAATSGSFVEGMGWYPGKPFARASPQLRQWGSWNGDDAHRGKLVLGPFAAPRVLRFGLSGYPSDPGNTLTIELVGTDQTRRITPAPVGERWEIHDHQLPARWEGRPIRIVAVDDATALGGWFGISEPIHGGRSDGNNALLESYTAWSLNGLVLGLLFAAAARILLSTTLPIGWQPLAAGAGVALVGYVTYWAYFAAPWLGWISTAGALLAAVLVCCRRAHSAASGASTGIAPTETRWVLTLMVTIGAFHLAVLHLFPTAHDFYTLTGNRFRDALPGDNALSHMYAERLFAGEPPKSSADEWQSSDRPPLQVGWQLLTWPLGKFLDLDRKTVSGTAAVWFQLLWVAGVYGLLRAFHLSPRRAAAWTAACGLSGFFLQNTTFTWPKLSAGAFGVAAFALLFLPAASPASSLAPHAARLIPGAQRLAASAAFAALAWLSHGGVAFSFLPLLPFVALRLVRDFRVPELRPAWFRAGLVFLALALPWIAYQKFYDPPGNLLLKYHFAGHQKQDARGVGETIRAAYAGITWQEAVANKAKNFHSLVFGEWRHLADFSAATKAERRNQEFFHVGRGLTWWPVLALLALVVARPLLSSPAARTNSFAACGPPVAHPDVLRLAGWLLGTAIVWCLLMFGAYTTSIHQGSYAMMLGLFVLFSVVIERSGRGWLLVLVVLQIVTLSTTWTVSNPAIRGMPTGLPLVIITGLVLGALIVCGFTDSDAKRLPPPSPAGSACPSEPRSIAAIRTWWTNPRITIPALAVIALVFFIRKPDALHTPQLWAEDGSIFLTQNDQFGPAALAMPYAGYLHTLPRLIAFVTAKISDPAWWPHVYNCAAFGLWLAAAARFFGPRFAHLPGRPWLALAFVAVPHSGEVFFNVTNLQWLTALVLVQQLLAAPPAHLRQRISDCLILAVIALTGPFGIAFLPLFFVQALFSAASSPRNPPAPSGVTLSRYKAAGRALLSPAARPALLAFATVLVCAAIQAWFVRNGPRFDYQSAPFELGPTLVVLARRLIVWPLLGRDLALHLSPAIIASIGVPLLLALAFWALRRDPLRRTRVVLLAAFGLITLAAVYRTRPDTWAADNLDYGDRYFYIPRVLLAWLLILEFHTKASLARNLARLACLTATVVHLPTFSLPAPKNYQWSQHVDPIRRGVRANIPTLPEGWTLEYQGRPK
jgi:hypothetical protein